MSDYLKTFSTVQTPQSEAIPGSTQVENNAGGYAWAIDDWKRLDRFAILGADGGTYYTSERKLTRENAESVLRCLQTDGLRVVARLLEISTEALAPKQAPTLFALAMAAKLGDEATRRAAWEAMPKVCRTGSHMEEFAGYIGQFGGWGKLTTKGFANWFEAMPLEKLAYQAIKYQSRGGWALSDLLRLSHPMPSSPPRNALYKWIVDGELTAPVVQTGDPDAGFLDPEDGKRYCYTLGSKAFPAIKRVNLSGSRLEQGAPQFLQVEAFDALKRLEYSPANLAEACRIIGYADLPREAVPTQWLKHPEIWDSLLLNDRGEAKMPITAMIRGLGKLTEVGLIKPLAKATEAVIAALADEDRLHKARIHPIALLSALKVYEQGHGERGSLKWEPVASVVDALDRAFYSAFQAVTPTGKRLLLGLDVSGSMTWGNIAGVPGLTPRVASAAMALVTAATEPNHALLAFAATPTSLAISPRQRLDDVLKTVDAIPMGGTDCALPMLWAMEKGLKIDSFLIYTDSETWAGMIHPSQALAQYRQRTGIPARLAVVAMTSSGFTIADPKDAGMLDVVGFDASTPALLSAFASGKL